VEIILAGGFFIIAVVLIGFHYSRSNSLLQQWAERNHYRLVEQEYRTFFRGPFFWTTSRGQTVYYVTVEDSQGKRRKGWVRCGGWLLGMLSNNVEVAWDE
jgi:hypothetical protein